MLEHGRKIATILAADVVGYSRLMGVDEARTLAALKIRRALFDQLVREHEGREFGSVGDSLMAEFPSVVNAVNCAQAIQHAIAKENETLPPEQRMSLRIGVNLGDVIEENGALFGDGVNVAARLQALAAPGGILISGAVYEHVRKKMPARLNYTGTRHVKNIAEPVAVYEVLTADQGSAFLRKCIRFVRRPAVATISLLALLAAGVLWWGWNHGLWQVKSKAGTPAQTADATSPERPSLAVLPFDSLGSSSENSYFADGMTDDIITDLSQLSGIMVIARNSSWTYKGKSVKVQQVAEDLGVRYVLEGSVRREGDTVRINAQLVDALGGQHLWADRYDGSIRDVFALQDKVIKKIVAALAVNLTHDERTRVELAETQNPQAYDAVLQGWAHYREGSEDETNKAIELFERAIALDPDYARAHAALAAASWRIVVSFWESTTEGGYQRAFDRMQLALAQAMRQPNALAHAVSAEVLSKQGLYAEAFDEINSAMALAPNDPDNYLRKANILNATGQAAEAEESVRWAMRLDPLYSPDYLRTLATSLFNQQRYAEAAATVERVIALHTDVPEDYITLIASLGYLGRKSDVPAALNTFNEMSVSAGYNLMTVQMFGAWWWYGDIFNYDPVYRDRLIEGLRKAGVPEGAGTDLPLEKYRALMHKNGAYFEVSGATTIDHKQAKALHDRGVKFVDVRAAKGFASGHVPGAFNLDVATELSRDSLSRIVAKDEEVVLSCHGKTCPDSAYASAKAVLWGFKHVYYFSGGFPAWKEAGYPVEASPTG
ncbi:MAG TPA: rhodanese-like domain-containing protein [Steroidobacteraceae bacterium]|nr:rhodanese-like domain-containing protein [Steroidobacteraceae bacterium]